jgi:hypothetical protein
VTSKPTSRSSLLNGRFVHWWGRPARSYAKVRRTNPGLFRTRKGVVRRPPEKKVDRRGLPQRRGHHCGPWAGALHWHLLPSSRARGPIVRAQGAELCLPFRKCVGRAFLTHRLRVPEIHVEPGFWPSVTAWIKRKSLFRGNRCFLILTVKVGLRVCVCHRLGTGALEATNAERELHGVSTSVGCRIPFGAW